MNNLAQIYGNGAPSVVGEIDASADAAATGTKAADEDNFWVVDWISFSYEGGTPAGNLKVTVGGTTVWEVDIETDGHGHIEFTQPLVGSTTKNQALAVVLGAGGSGITGKVQAGIR